MQTIKGTEKRKPLEEAKPLELQRPPKLRSFEAPGSILAVHSADLEAKRLKSFAYEYYSTTNDAKAKYQHMPIHSILTSILAHANADPVLDPALLALAMRVVAIDRRDAIMLSRANQKYTTALRALQLTLNSPEGAMRDETLAATVIMALFEVCYPSRASNNGDASI